MAVIGDLCKRCKKEPTVLISRKDGFCENCFIRFIRGKQRKQMQDEKFKVKFKDNIEIPRLMLDMENNQQSFVLLDMLVSMLSEQLSQGPKAIRGFQLHVCIIDDKFSDYKVNLDSIKQFYGIEELERLGINFITVDSNRYVTENKLENLRLELKKFQTFVIPETNQENTIKTYEELLLQINDKSTREDMAKIIHHDIVIQTANDHNCSIVLESDSMTTLAVKILSDTIRGRGSEIPILFQDKYCGNFEVLHPLQDILNSEIKMYTQIRELDALSELLQTKINSNISLKNKTVNTMVKEYFESLEGEYSEVVSTVVKIGAKLGNPTNTNGTKQEHCEICKTTIQHDPKKWLEQITVAGHIEPQNEEELDNFQRYLESMDPKKIVEPPTTDDDQVKLCYGCMVTLGVSNVEDFQWPKRPTREEILAEYILTDDEE